MTKERFLQLIAKIPNNAEMFAMQNSSFPLKLEHIAYDPIGNSLAVSGYEIVHEYLSERISND